MQHANETTNSETNAGYALLLTLNNLIQVMPLAPVEKLL